MVSYNPTESCMPEIPKELFLYDKRRLDETIKDLKRLGYELEVFSLENRLNMAQLKMLELQKQLTPLENR